MTRTEVRAAASLTSLYALRMLGLFLILPVFAVHAVGIEGGDNRTLVGLALGIYGLTQCMLQIPFGMASDRYGRKRVIIIGLVLFVIGSFVAAAAQGIWVTILGRALQGAGAISAAVTAFAADLTREQHRTKTMAAIGSSIALMFALSLVGAPALYTLVGMAGIFTLTGVLAAGAILVVIYVVPPEPAHDGPAGSRRASRQLSVADIGKVLANAELLRLNLGIFVLHLVQLAMFVVVPTSLLRNSGMPVDAHWKVYLPVVVVSLVLMVPPIIAAERGRMKLVFLSSVAAVGLTQVGLLLGLHSLVAVVVLLTVYFTVFNVLEAALPSLVTRFAPAELRGTAIGVYNTSQSLGLFAGGAVGGWLAQSWGESSVFVVGTALCALWLLAAWAMNPPGGLEKREFAMAPGADPEAVRERLVRVRGVRKAELLPAEGIARLTVTRGMLDEQAVLDCLGADPGAGAAPSGRQAASA
jgi:MFS family permease